MFSTHYGMTREIKAAILSAIREGRLKPSDLLEPENYVITHDASGYHWQGSTISKSHYRDLLEKHRKEARRREAFSLPVGYFITVQYTPAPFADGRPVTMDLTI